MKRTAKKNDLAKLNSKELAGFICDNLQPNMKEVLETVTLQLSTALNFEKDDEEIEFAIQVIKNISIKFSEHLSKENNFLFPLASKKLNNNGEVKKVTDFISERIDEHHWFKNQIYLLRKATHEFQCKTDSCPSQKLAYAHLHNLEQDFHRLIFVEEEYLFPMISKQNKYLIYN